MPPEIKEPVGLKGKFHLQVWNADGSLDSEGWGENILCVAGLTLLAQAINWSGITDQNAAMGSAFAVSTLAPLYGAIGTGTGTVADTDTTLYTEVNRAVVSGAGTGPATTGNPGTVTWYFFFGLPGSNTTVSEVGVFAQSTATANAASMLDHALVSPNVTYTTIQTLTMQVTFSFGN